MNLELSGTTAQQKEQLQTLIEVSEETKPKKGKEQPQQELFKPVITLNKLFEEYKEKAFNQKCYLGQFLFRGDFCIFFGSNNTGKSFFAYQLAQAIAEGKSFFEIGNYIEGHPSKQNKYYELRNDNPAETVIYLDFESRPEQLTLRYCNRKTRNHFQFSDNILPLFPMVRSIPNKMAFIDKLNADIPVKYKGAKVLIIDNLSAISVKGEESTFAGELMAKIKDLQDKHDLTVVILAHTPKCREGKPITKDDLAGSANFSNLIDSLFAIGKTSIGTNLRYIKQLKTKLSEYYFDDDRVIVIDLQSNLNGFTGYQFTGYESEQEIIKAVEKTEKQQEFESIQNSLTNLQLSAYDIAKQLHQEFGHNISFESYYRKVKKIVKRIREEQQQEQDPVNCAPLAGGEATGETGHKTAIAKQLKHSDSLLELITDTNNSDLKPLK